MNLEVRKVKIALLIVLAIASLALIASVLFQSGSSAGLSGSIAGGAEELFGKKKSKGYDELLAKVTAVAALVFIVVALVLVAIE